MMRISFLFVILLFQSISFAQRPVATNLIYVDKEGVIRYTKNNREAAFFGVNYTVPFAYGYRSHKALGFDLEKAIDADVYHMARLGLDAFRVHMWDVELTDSLGNLQDNEHLRLFDYLLMRLKERNIKILITPIAFWGNGYPEPDIKTNGFSYVYGKANAVVKEGAIRAQENYLKQLLAHINPYTKMTYKDDPDVIAMELNNEPHHSGPKEKTTEYINRLATAVRSTGWTKPLFYNISESPAYADAVAKSAVEGHSFQWYPTGLVANHEQRGNFLPNVDEYVIPFGDTIPAFPKKAKMVYEFDAGDVLQPIMYPAMARSFRTAGFQWATQFAYDPMATAYANTEYQTHYLNLVYTPAKAISLLIASKAFHQLPRLRSYGSFPADTLFDVFRISYQDQLSEMNADTAFYYTNHTSTVPRNLNALRHIAGLGNSTVIKYAGSGAYFLDKTGEGQWRLEILPDAIRIGDPFEKASPKKTVTQINRKENPMQIDLPGLEAFYIQGVNAGNEMAALVQHTSFQIKPGVYLISRNKISDVHLVDHSFYAPRINTPSVMVIHKPWQEVQAGKSIFIDMKIVGLSDSDRVSLELHTTANMWQTLPLQRLEGYQYRAAVPADLLIPGQLYCRIFIYRKQGDTLTFPGGYAGNPYAWDNWHNETWQTNIADSITALDLFNPNTDRTKLLIYNADWRNNSISYMLAEAPDQLILAARMNKPPARQAMAWQCYFADRIKGRNSELSKMKNLVVRARSRQAARLKVTLVTTTAMAYSTTIALSDNWKDNLVSLRELTQSSYLLLPRPYPGFLPLYFSNNYKAPIDLTAIERIEFSFEAGESDKPVTVELGKAWLTK